jgi:purine-binding chemotaxis protein CheW
MGQSVRLVSFLLGSETFVLDIMLVREIVPHRGSTPVPAAPAFIEGIIVHRNEVVPIVDLRRRLCPELTGPVPEPMVLVTATPRGTFGFKVDQVRRIVTADPDSFLPAPPVLSGVRSDLLVGIVPLGGTLCLLIDPEHVLTEAEQEALRAAGITAGARQPPAG